jgi:FlaA1/EpsC-like NDP-sugar epimerase
MSLLGAKKSPYFRGVFYGFYCLKMVQLMRNYEKAELIFNLISIPVDALSLLLAGIASFYLRQHYTDVVGPIIYRLDLSLFLSVVYKIIPVLLLFFAFLGLYNLKGTRKFTSELGRVIVGVSLGLLLVILLFFFNQSIFPSRFIILATWGLGILFVIIGRLVLKYIQIFLFQHDIGLHKLVIINGRGNELNIIEQVFKDKGYGYQVTADLTYSDDTFERLEKYSQEKNVDEILQADSSLSEAVNLKLVEFARNKGLKFSFVPNLFEVQRNIIETEELQGIPVISLKNTPLTDGARW